MVTLFVIVKCMCMVNQIELWFAGQCIYTAQPQWLHVYECWDLILLQCTTCTGRHHSVCAANCIPLISDFTWAPQYFHRAPNFSVFMGLQIYTLTTGHCHRSSIIDFTEDQQLMSVYIYILIIIITVYVSYEAIDQWERRMTGHVICIQIIKLIRGPFEHLVIKSPFLVI